jgi:hypothetical protein
MKSSYIFIPALLLSAGMCFAQQKNLALNKDVAANSEDSRFPAKNAVDGKITRNSKWMSGNVKPPHILEIDLKKYCNINSIIVHTGIPEAERTAAENSQAAGFWSAKNFKLQYWDDANWTDISNTEVHENRLTDVKYTFAQPVNTFKIRFVCDDGEPISIMEIEVFGTEQADRPVAGSTASSLKKASVITGDQKVNIKVGKNTVGKTMKYVAYNQGYYMPGSNTSGWLEYAGVNSLRIWITLNSYAPVSAIQLDKSLDNVEEFDKRKAELRANPEGNRFIKWDKLIPLYGATESETNTNPMIWDYAMLECKRLGIDPIIQFGSTDFNETWSNKWQQWQRYYALAYYAARKGDVTMFAMQNEPNHKNAGMKLDQWIGGMQIVSDALECAVNDVNKKYGKHLKARMVGPVTAGNNPEWWAAIAKAQRTDYHGKTIDHDLLGIFSTHSYNSPAAGYENRVNNIRKILVDNHPQHTALPITYTELGRWMNAYLIDKEETMDSPSLFTEWAGIYTNNTTNGAYGMWAFKFANTTSNVYPMGIKSGHHFTWQGKRIVEDAYTNLAKNKPATASYTSGAWTANKVTDGDKSDRSAWRSDSAGTEKWLEINLGGVKSLGSAVVYTGSAGGVYTATDRIKNYKLQYLDNNAWKDIPGTVETANKYAQVFRMFTRPVKTSKVRFVSSDPGVLKVREIKLFAEGDGPADNQANYDISGIQRAGEVVRLFAKGFKEERPMLQTTTSVDDDNLDALTSYDAASGNYYMWLVQRGLYKDNISIDLSALNISAGTPVTAEAVGPKMYGEVAHVLAVTPGKTVNLALPSQSVILLTIPSKRLIKQSLRPAADATVSAGKNAAANYGLSKQLTIALDASKPENNQVSYIRFNLSGKNLAKAKRILLKVNGSNVSDTSTFRFHVYGMPANEWAQQTLSWKNAPQLDAKEALITGVGQKAYVAGELAMNNIKKNHFLDVTALVKKHAGKSVTFALVRETRQLGDDEDKGKKIMIDSSEGQAKPELLIWSAQ